MFTSKKNERDTSRRSNTVNLITQGTEIVGNISTHGDIRIDGVVQGDITCHAKLVVGQEGQVQGNIQCHTGEISGSIQGRITATDMLQLSKGANIQGDIEAVRFVVEEGASLNGKCQAAPDLEVQRLLEITPYEEPKALTQ